METHTPTPEKSIEQKAQTALSVDSIDELRKAQKEACDEDLGAFETKQEKERRIATEMYELTTNYLGDHGITPESTPDYGAYLWTALDFAYDTMSDSEWYWGHWEDDEHTKLSPSGRDLMRQRQVDLFGDGSAEPDEGDEDAEVSPELGLARTALEEKREALARISAKRQGKAFSLNSDDYDEARGEYNQALVELAKLELADQLADTGKTDSEKDTEVTAYLVTEQAALRERTTELVADKKFAGFVDAVGKWLTSGGAGSRALKMALGGVLGVGAGLALGAVLAPVAGAGVAIGGGALVAKLTGAARIAAAREAQAGRQMQAIGDSDKLALRRAIEDARGDDGGIEVAIDHLDNLFDKANKKEQNKRLKSLAWGIGTIAVSSAAAAVLTNVVDHFLGGGHHDVPSNQHNNSPGQFNGDNPTPYNPVIDRDVPGAPLHIGEVLQGPSAVNYPDMITASRGDSLWNIGRDMLHQAGVEHPSLYQLDAVKDALVASNATTGPENWIQIGQQINTGAGKAVVASFLGH